MAIRCLSYEKIIFIIVSVLKKLAESSDNKLDDQLVDIIEYTLFTALNPNGIINDWYLQAFTGLYDLACFTGSSLLSLERPGEPDKIHWI